MLRIFIYQSGRQIGPYSEEEVRLKLLAGRLRTSDLAWHSRLAEWVPLGALGATPLLEQEREEPPAPETSSHYVPPEAEKPVRRERRRRLRRSQSEPSLPGESNSTPMTEMPRKVESESHPPRVARKRKVKPKKEEREVSLWALVKWFFAN